MNSPLILCLDGSTGVCSVALVSPANAGGRVGSWTVVARRREEDGRAQAKVLLRLIDEMLHEIREEPQGLSGSSWGPVLGRSRGFASQWQLPALWPLHCLSRSWE